MMTDNKEFWRELLQEGIPYTTARDQCSELVSWSRPHYSKC